MPAASSDKSVAGNRLLNALPPDSLKRLLVHQKTVSLELNQSIHEPGNLAQFVLFPLQGLISSIATTAEGASIEIGMIGREGMFGVPAILGDERPLQRAIVQLPGSALRIPAELLRREMSENASLQTLLLRYVQVTLSTTSQAAACNRLHLLEQRCARWLLSSHDRSEGDKFPMTHEFLAIMLGVRRSGVTVAAQSLQAAGLIAYSHGTITIRDREGLEAASCGCYRFIENEFQRLLEV
jgi:CRP-like cAMP-binding protein